MTRSVLVAGVAGLLLGGVLTGAAGAQTVPLKAEDVVKVRQAGMAMTGSIAEGFKAAVAAGADPKTFTESAAALAAWAETYAALFPEGTQNVGGTKAKAEIWTVKAGWEKANAAFVTASVNLANAAKSGDKAAFAAAFQAEGQTCGGCHRAFKAR